MDGPERLLRQTSRSLSAGLQLFFPRVWGMAWHGALESSFSTLKQGCLLCSLTAASLHRRPHLAVVARWVWYWLLPLSPCLPGRCSGSSAHPLTSPFPQCWPAHTGAPQSHSQTLRRGPIFVFQPVPPTHVPFPQIVVTSLASPVTL